VLDRLTPLGERLYLTAKSTKREVQRDPARTMTADELRVLVVGLAGLRRAPSREACRPHEGV
jgi:hypothetical protein